MPSKAVDEAWHEMILMTREYTYFCDRAFGRYLHHNPDSTLTVSMDEILAETLAIVDAHELPMALFTADEDAGLEDGYVWRPTDLHRMRDTIAHRERDRRAGASAGAGTGFAGGYVAGDGSTGDSSGWSFFGSSTAAEAVAPTAAAAPTAEAAAAAAAEAGAAAAAAEAAAKGGQTP